MKLFISYRHKDLAFAQQIANQLRTCINGYLFFDERSIDQADFEKSILTHLRQSDVVVVIVTENTFAPERIKQTDDWIRREIQEALRLNKDIIPICINTSLPLAYQLPFDMQGLTRMNALDFYFGQHLFEASMQRLIDLINRIAGTQGSSVLAKTTSALRIRDYTSARQELQSVLALLGNYVEPHYRARAEFYKALIVLGRTRPSTQTLPLIEKVDDYMQTAINQHRCAAYLRIWGLLKLDFGRNHIRNYEEEGKRLLNGSYGLPWTKDDDDLWKLFMICQSDLVEDYSG